MWRFNLDRVTEIFWPVIEPRLWFGKNIGDDDSIWSRAPRLSQ
jgi:hypothetical protein